MQLTINHDGAAGCIVSDAVVTSVTGDSSPIQALWDTGATGTMITENIAQRLKLKYAGYTKYNHAGGVSIANKYIATIEIQGDTMQDVLKFEGVILPAMSGVHPVDMLIGMDIIALGEFTIKNVNGNSVFTFKY